MKKIKIIDDGNLENDIFKYLMANSLEFARESTINSILGEDFTMKNKKSLIYNTQLSIYGTTFQGNVVRDDLDVSYASHVVKQFIREDYQLYGIIEFLDTAIGKGLTSLDTLKFSDLNLEYKLMPIYTSDRKLSGFDIDTNIKPIDGTESFH